MRITRKTDIIIKTERKFVVQHGTASEFSVCRQCGEAMISVFMSVDFFGFSSRIIYRLIEADSIHFFETATKEIYICSASVRRALKNITP